MEFFHGYVGACPASQRRRFATIVVLGTAGRYPLSESPVTNPNCHLMGAQQPLSPVLLEAKPRTPVFIN